MKKLCDFFHFIQCATRRYLNELKNKLPFLPQTKYGELMATPSAFSDRIVCILQANLLFVLVLYLRPLHFSSTTLLWLQEEKVSV